MSHYKKKPGVSGSHGTKFEVNLLLYYVSKAYLSNADFKISNGIENEPKLDDIILKTDTFEVFAQAKHVDNKQKKIKKSQLFAESGKYSLNVYLTAAYGIFKQTINLIPLENETIEISWPNFQKTKFHLVTNISPNAELTALCSRASTVSESLEYFEEIQEYYNFNTEDSINQLSTFVKDSVVPKWFIKIFLVNFYLIVIPDNALKEYNENLLKILSAKTEIPHEITSSKMYLLIEEWQSKRDGIYLTRNEVNSSIFSYIASEHFKQKLRVYNNLIEFNLNILLNTVKNNVITTVTTPRYLLIIPMLQKEFEREKTLESLFVNPFLDMKKQTFLINAFLHEKHTHLICVVQDCIEAQINQTILKITQNEKFLQYKKIILFCEKEFKNSHIQSELLTDSEWFENRKLNIYCKLNSFEKIQKYYIPRKLRHKNVSKSEEEFLKEIYETKNLKIIGISESAGMGKTSLLLSLSDKINSENYFWSIVIKLNQFTKLLERHLNSKTIPELQEFLKLLVKSDYGKTIATIPNILILMVDGFDEISPDYKEIVTEFLKNTRLMKNVKAILVTTRSYIKTHLETKLDVSMYELIQLGTAEVCRLICKHGQYNLRVVEKWYNSLPLNIRDMLKNPLYATIFAQTYPLTDKTLQANNLNMNLYEIYESFVEKNKDIFINEKSNCQGNIYNKKIQCEKLQKLVDFCMEFALEMTFKQDCLKQLGVVPKEESTFGEEICAYGIFETTQTSLVFVHETFKEFFEAKWVLREIFDSSKHNFKVIETILKEILMKFYQSKIFIEHYLRTNWHQLTDDILELIGSIVSDDRIFFRMLYVNYEFPYIVKLMLEKSSNKSLFNSLLINVVDFGSKSLQADIVLMLLQKGAEANLKNVKGKTIVHVVCENGNTELLKYLVDGKICNLDEENNKGVTPLILALVGNNFEIVNYLIEQGADINKLETKIEIMLNKITKLIVIEPVVYDENLYSKYQVNGLHIAAYKGNFNLIKLIVSKNICSKHEKTSHGWNVLHCAVQSGNLDIIKYLVNLGIETDQVTKYGETVLHIAVRNRKIDLVRYFVEFNVKIDAITNTGDSALGIAFQDKNPSIVQYLLGKYLTLEISDASSIYNALYIIVRKPLYNSQFNSMYKKYNDKLSIYSQSDLLAEAIRWNNIEIVNYFKYLKIPNLK